MNNMREILSTANSTPEQEEVFEEIEEEEQEDGQGEQESR